MTMYHMAMPPQFGGGHQPPIHSMFPAPLLPPINHSHSVHTFPPSSTGSTTTETSRPVILHSSPIISQNSFYPSHQPSVYVNPYMSSHPTSPIQPAGIMHHHGLPNDSHLHSRNLSYIPVSAGLPLLHMNPSDRRVIQDHALNFENSKQQTLSVDEELLHEMHTLHLGYLETEDSPHKMEQREKLESVIMEYLAITPHSHKFMFQQVPEVLRNSVMSRLNFTARDAACAFDALAQYAANLVSQPWRKEFREIKLHNGFWVHQVGNKLAGADSILELMGYTSVSSKGSSVATDVRTRCSPEHYVLPGVIDPDLLARLALDCMIAYCECQCLNKIKEGISEFGLSWGQILQYRQLYIGGVEVTLRHLLFTLRQYVNPPISYSTPLSPESSLPTTPPPIPARQSSSFSATSSAHYLPPPSPKAPPTLSSPLQHSPVEVKLETSASFEDCHAESSLHHSPDNQKNGRSLSLTGCNSTLGSSAPFTKQSITKSNYQDKSNIVHASSSGNVLGGPSLRVPTAKLIDLDSSNETVPPHFKSNHHLLPKVLPHKSNLKNGSHSTTNRCSVTNDHPEAPTSPAHPPPEAFQAGTLEEHLEATLSLVKNPNRNSAQTTKGSEGNSLDTWDFVFRGLEKKGYSKDIGDRGDILHDMARIKNCVDSGASSSKNVNLNLNNQRKDTKNRPLTINQALHQFNLHESTKERIERPPPSSKSSHSISHAYVHESHKRNSLYDNLSGGFETANQDSEGSEDRRSFTLKKVPNAARQDLSHQRIPEGHKNCDASSASSSQRSAKLHKLAVPKAKVSQPERANSGERVTWPCVTCTFENPSGVSICEMCGKSKNPGPEAFPLESGGKQCHLCTLINERSAEVCSACGVDLKGSSTYI